MCIAVLFRMGLPVSGTSIVIVPAGLRLRLRCTHQARWRGKVSATAKEAFWRARQILVFLPE